MRPEPLLLDTFDLAGIAWRVECGERAFGALLASRYAEFATDAPPELSLRVEVRPPHAEAETAGPVGRFARIERTGGFLSIEGPHFRGTFDEHSGQGWIVQPPDPAPLETFLAAVLARRLLREGGFLLHAAGIVAEHGASVFFGPSGSGKTTVAGLVGEGVISDDIVAIRRSGDRFRVWGVPWRGRRRSAPLGRLLRLRKAPETAFVPLSSAAAVRELLTSVCFSGPDRAEAERFLEIAGGLVTRVPVYEMRFTPDLSFWRSMPRNGRREGNGVSL